MIWSIVSRYAELAQISAALSPAAAYAILDGLFQQALLRPSEYSVLATTNLTANIDPVDFTPVLDTTTLFGSIQQAAVDAIRSRCCWRNLCGCADRLTPPTSAVALQLPVWDVVRVAA